MGISSDFSPFASGGFNIPPIFWIIAIILIIYAIYLTIKTLSTSNSWKKELQTNVFEKDLLFMVENRVKTESISTYDLFDADSILAGTNKLVVATPEHVLSPGNRFGRLNDLFADKDNKIPAAMTEMRYVLPMPGLSNLDGMTVTRTLHDNIVMKITKGIMHVYLNGKEIGVIDLFAKKITANDKIIGTLDFPSLYPFGIVEIDWDIYFDNKKAASIVASQNMIKSIVRLIPGVKLRTAECFFKLTKEQKTFVISLILFMKIKNSLRP